MSNLTYYLTTGLVTIGLLGCIHLLAQGQPTRLSGNCGPAAVGLTPEGDVVPIKVDFGGYVIPSIQLEGKPRP